VVWSALIPIVPFFLASLLLDGPAQITQSLVASGVDLANVNFRYAIEGDRAPWRPLRAFDDGRQVFIEFPRGIGQGEMPPLFVVGPEGNTSELVNYRVRGHHMIVDRLFAAAELRFGSGREQKRVRIVRTDGRPTS
ncbi:TrbG/VirB9 family P-type conjugative transfer protein, partial [Citrobacter freundii]|uniref:TrbG/VirB9 family P-type conjugative transfer protein n=1 Tax=Citrobacter freundii TaxID=546 RepID=UPI003AAC30CD